MTTTTDGAPAPVRRPWLDHSRGVTALTVLLAAAAVGLYAAVVLPLPAPAAAPHLPWLLWLAAFAVGETTVVQVQFERESHSFSLADLVLAAGLCLLPPAALVPALAGGAGLSLFLHGRQRGLRLAFNLAQYGMAGCLGALVVATLGDGSAGGSVRDWAAVLAAIATTTVAADLAIFGVISLADGRADLRRLVGMVRLSLPFTLGAGAVGLLLARTAVHDPAALPLLALPTVLVVVSYRAYTRAREQQDNLRLLHEVTSLLHQGGDADAALGDFLTSVRTAFRAEVAELVLLGSDDVRVSRSLEGAEPVVMAPLEDADDHRRLLRLASASGVLTTRSSGARTGQLDAHATARGWKDAMAAALRTEDRVHGLLVVASRVGDVVTFGPADRALLETFARHVATSLERGRLETNLRQVTDLKEQLRHQALHDALTGLPNRALFLDRVRQAVESAPRTGLWPTVLYLDLDGFKPVNDTHGHDCGDLMLRNVAARLRGCLRPSDTAARLGGDEFAVLLTDPVDAEGLERVVERICTQVAVPVDLGAGRYATVRTSIGVATGSPRTRTADDLVRNADVAMYTAKRRGGSRHVVFDPQEGDPVPATLDTAAELTVAVRAGQIAVVYQPLVDLASGRVVGAEALARWPHPVDGTRLPERFIKLAEDTGLIGEVGGMVLRDACRQAAAWVRAGAPADLLVTVNLCAAQLADPGLPAQVHDALTAAGLDPRHLVLEITETALMQDRETAAATLWRLRDLGVRVAIDDFGTGYSSLAYLRRFPIDMLKVAREFVDGLGRDVHDDVITRAIVDLAGTLGLLTVAEGVETEEQRRHVTELGCDLAQGFLFAHPVAADEVAALLAPASLVRPRPADMAISAEEVRR